MHWDSKILLTRGIPIFIEFMDSIVSLDSINLEKQNLKNQFFNSTKKNCWFEKLIFKNFFLGIYRIQTVKYCNIVSLTPAQSQQVSTNIYIYVGDPWK